MKGGIIAIKLSEDDELVDVVIAKTGDEIVLATARGMAIRFSESDARPMGRDTSGVKGIRLARTTSVVGMVVADPEATLLTACANGYGKRTPFGPNLAAGLRRASRQTASRRRRSPEQDDGPEHEAAEGGARRGRRRGRGRAFVVAVLSHATPRRQGRSRHQDHPAQRPGDRHRPHPRGRRTADDDRPRQDPANPRRRHQHHRPQHPGRADHESRQGDTLVAVKRVPMEEEKEENGKGEEG